MPSLPAALALSPTAALLVLLSLSLRVVLVILSLLLLVLLSSSVTVYPWGSFFVSAAVAVVPFLQLLFPIFPASEFAATALAESSCSNVVNYSFRFLHRRATRSNSSPTGSVSTAAGSSPTYFSTKMLCNGEENSCLPASKASVKEHQISRACGVINVAPFCSVRRCEVAANSIFV